MAVEILPLTLKDLSAVDTINKVCLPENYDLITWFTILMGPNNICLGAFVDNILVGYVCIVDYTATAHRTKSAQYHVVSFAVLPHYRGNGYGKRLMQDAIMWLSKRRPKVNSLDLNVRVDNHRAIQLYTKLGFKMTSTTSSYYKDGTDAHVMTLAL